MMAMLIQRGARLSGAKRNVNNRNHQAEPAWATYLLDNCEYFPSFLERATYLEFVEQLQFPDHSSETYTVIAAHCRKYIEDFSDLLHFQASVLRPSIEFHQSQYCSICMHYQETVSPTSYGPFEHHADLQELFTSAKNECPLCLVLPGCSSENEARRTLSREPRRFSFQTYREPKGILAYRISAN